MKEIEPRQVEVKNGKIEAVIVCDNCGKRWEDWIELGWRKQPPRTRPTVKGRCEICLLMAATPAMREAYFAKFPEARAKYEAALERRKKAKEGVSGKR